MCSFQLDFKRARGCKYGISRLCQNKMKRLWCETLLLADLQCCIRNDPSRQDIFLELCDLHVILKANCMQNLQRMR